MKINENNPVLKQQQLEAEIDRLKKANANLAAANHEWETVASLGGWANLKLPPEVEAMVRNKMEMGLDEHQAIVCALKQHEHDKKLATLAEKDAASKATLAEATAEAEAQREKEQAVLQEITRQVLERAKTKTSTSTLP